MSDIINHHYTWKVAGLGEETIKKVLKNSGMTEREAEVYIYLAKHGASTSREIARLMKKDKAQIFRILKRLQTKGFVEATIEFPVRYTVVPFENVLDSVVKAKKEEVAFIEEAKKDLLDYLSKKSPTEASMEKFVVIKGNKRIYSKISKIIQDTRSQLSIATTLPSLMRAERFGVFDAAFNHPLRSKIQFRFLTELSEQNLNAVKTLLNRAPKTAFNFKARNPDLGLTLFPRMITRDNEEILFFTTTPITGKSRKEDACLWTNCKSLVQAFTAIFEDLWRNSTDMQTKIMEIETGKPTPKTYIIKDAEAAHKKYIDTMRAAQKEVLMMTSSEGLIRIWKNKPLVKGLAERSVSTEIMAPIISENLKVAQELSKFCEVKHVSTNYFGTTIVDGKHLFQFKEATKQGRPETISYFKNTFYTNDFEYVKKTESMLKDIWKNAYKPSAITLESILENAGPEMAPFSKRVTNYLKKTDAYAGMDDKPPRKLSEKDVLNKIIHAEEYPIESSSKVIDRMYATVGLAVIHPPNSFNLPDMVVMIFDVEKQSRLGEEDAMMIYLQLETPRGYNYVPVAIIDDNPRAHDYWKSLYAGTPAGQNTKLIRKDEIQIRVYGNTLFAGWTVPIQLFPQQLTLPPACIQIEGYGDVRTTAYTLINPSGYTQKVEENYFDAFVTFFHPSSKYSGAGTDGFFIRDFVVTGYAPSTKQENNRSS
jgi:sugar-specific transcriptional regulator TrmB